MSYNKYTVHDMWYMQDYRKLVIKILYDIYIKKAKTIKIPDNTNDFCSISPTLGREYLGRGFFGQVEQLSEQDGEPVTIYNKYMKQSPTRREDKWEYYPTQAVAKVTYDISIPYTYIMRQLYNSQYLIPNVPLNQYMRFQKLYKEYSAAADKAEFLHGLNTGDARIFQTYDAITEFIIGSFIHVFFTELTPHVPNYYSMYNCVTDGIRTNSIIIERANGNLEQFIKNTPNMAPYKIPFITQMLHTFWLLYDGNPYLRIQHLDAGCRNILYQRIAKFGEKDSPHDIIFDGIRTSQIKYFIYYYKPTNSCFVLPNNGIILKIGDWGVAQMDLKFTRKATDNEEMAKIIFTNPNICKLVRDYQYIRSDMDKYGNIGARQFYNDFIFNLYNLRTVGRLKSDEFRKVLLQEYPQYIKGNIYLPNKKTIRMIDYLVNLYERPSKIPVAITWKYFPSNENYDVAHKWFTNRKIWRHVKAMGGMRFYFLSNTVMEGFTSYDKGCAFVGNLDALSIPTNTKNWSFYDYTTIRFKRFFSIRYPLTNDIITYQSYPPKRDTIIEKLQMYMDINTPPLYNNPGLAAYIDAEWHNGLDMDHLFPANAFDMNIADILKITTLNISPPQLNDTLLKYREYQLSPLAAQPFNPQYIDKPIQNIYLTLGIYGNTGQDSVYFSCCGKSVYDVARRELATDDGIVFNGGYFIWDNHLINDLNRVKGLKSAVKEHLPLGFYYSSNNINIVNPLDIVGYDATVGTLMIVRNRIHIVPFTAFLRIHQTETRYINIKLEKGTIQRMAYQHIRRDPTTGRPLLKNPKYAYEHALVCAPLYKYNGRKIMTPAHFFDQFRTVKGNQRYKISSNARNYYKWITQPGEISVTDGIRTSRQFNPQTIIGLTPKNKFVVMLIDGRYSRGIGLDRIYAAYLINKLGLKTAMSLDGGWSSNMVASFMNDEGERQFRIMSPEINANRAVSSTVVIKLTPPTDYGY